MELTEIIHPITYLIHTETIFGAIKMCFASHLLVEGANRATFVTHRECISTMITHFASRTAFSGCALRLALVASVRAQWLTRTQVIDTCHNKALYLSEPSVAHSIGRITMNFST